MNEAKDLLLQSLFRVTRYAYYNITRCRWPEFKLSSHLSVYFKTLAEAEEYVRNSSSFPLFDTYAHVIAEIPVGIQVYEGIAADNLSVRIYLPDGQLWGMNEYAHIMQWGPPYPGGELELGHYLGRRRMFYGRRADDIRFKPGDIVEVFGYSGNPFWSNNFVTLAIVVKVPPSVEEISSQLQQYLASHSGYDVSDHSLGSLFDYKLDTYEVIPYGSGGIDHSPTIATMRPSLAVSPRRAKSLKLQYEKYINGEL